METNILWDTDDDFQLTLCIIMHEPLLNIHFHGSGIEGSRQTFASSIVASCVKNRIILSGVGAPDGYDPMTQEPYPTPGTFRINHLKREAKPLWSNVLMKGIARSAGWIFGYGEKNNLTFALACIRHKIEMLDRHSVKNMSLNISGYSRGGTSALCLAHLIKALYGNQIRLNLFLLDPNAGLGQHHILRKRRIPDNVQRLYMIFNRDERIHVFKSYSFSHFILENPELHYAALYVAGSHLAQEKFPNGDIFSSPALTNQSLLSLFYFSFNAISNLNELYLHSKNVQLDKIHFTQPKKLIDYVINELK